MIGSYDPRPPLLAAVLCILTVLTMGVALGYGCHGCDSGPRIYWKTGGAR